MSEKCLNCKMLLSDPETGQGSGDECGYCWTAECQAGRAEDAEKRRDELEEKCKRLQVELELCSLDGAC